MTSLSDNSSKDDSLKFIFKFTVFEVVAEALNHQMVIRFGLKTSVFQLDAIRYLYFRDLKDQKMSEITVAVSSGPKFKRTRIYADIDEESFHDLWHYLKEISPDADISGLPIDEAYQLMGSRNLPWLAVSGVMSIGVLLVALFSIPLLIHGFDQGQEQLDLERAYQLQQSPQNLTSRNLTFRGWVDLERAWRYEDQQGSYTELKLVVPIYPPSIHGQQELPPARFFVLARDHLAHRLVEQPAVIMREGVLRNIWWEGLGNLAYQKLKKNGVNISLNPELIELGEIKVKRRDDLMMYLTSVGVLSLITLIITLYLKPASQRPSV